jgi:hypothetical protein
MNSYVFHVWYGATYVEVKIYGVESQHAYETVAILHPTADSINLER